MRHASTMQWVMKRLTGRTRKQGGEQNLAEHSMCENDEDLPFASFIFIGNLNPQSMMHLF